MVNRTMNAGGREKPRTSRRGGPGYAAEALTNAPP